MTRASADGKDDIVLTEEEMRGSSSALAELAPVSVSRRDRDKMTKAERLEEVQSSLLERSTEVLDATLAFAEVNPESDEPPEAWVRELGRERAERRLRIAKAGWLSGKSAPVAITVARNIYVGIVKAEAQKAAPPAQLNVAVQMNVAVPEYEEVEVE